MSCFQRTPRRAALLAWPGTIRNDPASQPFDAHCCHMDTAMPDRVKPWFVIFDTRAFWRSALSVRVPGCQKYNWRLNPVWHRMLYSCTLMATVGVKGLTTATASYTHTLPIRGERRRRAFRAVQHVITDLQLSRWPRDLARSSATALSLLEIPAFLPDALFFHWSYNIDVFDSTFDIFHSQT